MGAKWARMTTASSSKVPIPVRGSGDVGSRVRSSLFLLSSKFIYGRIELFPGASQSSYTTVNQSSSMNEDCAADAEVFDDVSILSHDNSSPGRN